MLPCAGLLLYLFNFLVILLFDLLWLLHLFLLAFCGAAYILFGILTHIDFGCCFLLAEIVLCCGRLILVINITDAALAYKVRQRVGIV